MDFPGTRWRFPGTRLGSLELVGGSLDLVWVPWNSLEVPWISFGFPGTRWRFPGTCSGFSGGGATYGSRRADVYRRAVGIRKGEAAVAAGAGPVRRALEVALSVYAHGVELSSGVWYAVRAYRTGVGAETAAVARRRRKGGLEARRTVGAGIREGARTPRGTRSSGDTRRVRTDTLSFPLGKGPDPHVGQPTGHGRNP